MLEKGLFLISLIGFCGVIAIFTLVNPENVFAFKPIGPTEVAPTQPLERPETILESPLSMPAAAPFLNYENSTFGMRISYPSNWTRYESQNGSSILIVQFTEGPYNENNNNYTKEVSSGGLAIKGASFTLNSSNSDTSLWVQEQLNRFINSLSSFKLGEMKSIILNSHQQNIPATMTSYSYRDSLNHEVNAFIINVLKDGRGYSLEYSAEPKTYSKNLPILLEMVKTFEVTQTPYTTMVIPASNNFKSYENSSMGIKIQYPENWIFKEKKDGEYMKTMFDFPGGMLRVSVFPSAYSSSQEAAIVFTNSLNQSFSDFNFIRSEPINLRGANLTSSNLLVYTVNTEVGSINKEMMVITVFGGRVYVILYSTDLAVFPIFEPTIQRMIDSFQITDTSDTIAAGSTNPISIPLTYENPVYGVKIDYPSNWSVIPGENASSVSGIVKFFSPENVDYVSVGLYVEDLSASGSGQNLNQYLTSSMSLYSTPDLYPDFSLNSSEMTGSIAGTPAYSLEGRYNDATLGIQNLMDTGTVRGNLAYYIQYIGSPSKYVEYLPTVKAMIDSIEITKSTPTPTPSSLSNKFGLDKTQNILLDNGTSFPIKYRITGGKVSNMDIERSSDGTPSLIIRIDPEVSEDSYKGKLVVEIPSMVIGSNKNFYVYDNVSPTEWKKLAGDSNTAIVEAAFFNGEPGLRTIEILGAG